ncbi:MAG: hypothetical protein M0C28_13775 [Candidatus Moduliflexus flocculans]|nr:hypothetical protein [Candidatus Moduliflexus flocculans]
MNTQRKRVVVAVTVLAAFAVAAVPASAGEVAEEKATAPAYRVGRLDQSAEAQPWRSITCPPSRRHRGGPGASPAASPWLWGRPASGEAWHSCTTSGKTRRIGISSSVWAPSAASW